MTSVTAFVLVTVPAPESGGVVSKLHDNVPEVQEVAAVYGEADVVVKIRASSIERLHELVMNDIQKLDHVDATRTFIIIPTLHKWRSAGA